MPYIQDQPGLRRTNKGPRGTNQDPAIRIRVIWDGSGPAGPNKTPEWIGPRGTYQCPKWTSQGPAGRIMGPMGKPRPRRTNQGPVGRIRPSETSLGPTGRIRTPGRIEPRGMSQGPPEQLRACGTLPGPSGRIRALFTNQGPKGRIRTPRDRVGPRGTTPAQCFSMPSHSTVNRTPPDAYVIFRPISVDDSAEQR